MKNYYINFITHNFWTFVSLISEFSIAITKSAVSLNSLSLKLFRILFGSTLGTNVSFNKLKIVLTLLKNSGENKEIDVCYTYVDFRYKRNEVVPVGQSTSVRRSSTCRPADMNFNLSFSERIYKYMNRIE